jgi:Trk-type K+ transport system membrane component
MTTAGGGWTLGLNSVFGDTSSTSDMVSNTGTVGIGTGHTRDMSELAINQKRSLRRLLHR